MKGLSNNRRGTSLVEILVVMLVLLVGIMTVIQMFPTGFRVVRAAESQTIASKLAQAEVERWKNMPGNLPDGVLPIKPDGTVINDQNPGPPFFGFSNDLVGGIYEAGNVINSRYVRNETTPIPVGSFFTSGAGAAYGSKYTLAFSPIEVSADPDNPGLYLGLTIKSGDLQRRIGSSDSRIFLRAGQYGIDYDLTSSGGLPAFMVNFNYDRNPNHAYHISYSYWVENKSTGEATLLSEVDQTVRPSPDGDWVPVEIRPPDAYPLSDFDVTEVEEGADSCARGFVQVPPRGWSNDPYEFALVDSIMGVVAFNPRARNMTERTARGVRAITARIDYRIYDPRIIREDRIVPPLNEDPFNEGENTHSAIKLALRFILNAGSPMSITDGDATDNPDEPTFEGLVKRQLGMPLSSPADLLVPQSVLIIDLATGLRVEIPPDAPPFYAIDYKAGVVHLPKKANLIDWNSEPLSDTHDVPLAGRHLRFFYRADGDWSVQCQKAYSYYLRKRDTSRVDYRHFKLRTAPSGQYQLLFARSDSGKDVTVDYSYWIGNVEHKVVGKLYRLSDDWTADPDAPNVKCAYVNLDIPPGGVIDSGSRIVVVGASFRARVTWRDGRNWRFVDIDTDLTRNSSP
ncbi:MAG: hypothetical protein ACOX3G_11365 [Armatimonadota bacterium]